MFYTKINFLKKKSVFIFLILVFWILNLNINAQTLKKSSEKVTENNSKKDSKQEKKKDPSKIAEKKNDKKSDKESKRDPKKETGKKSEKKSGKESKEKTPENYAIAANYIRTISVSKELEESGKALYTIRIVPKKTYAIETMIIECVYRQVFMFENSRGQKYEKTHEPFSFKYWRRNIKQIDDLAYYINFRIPLSHKRLDFIYGKKAFLNKYPVTVNRINIKTEVEGKELWNLQLKGEGKFTWNEKENKWILEPQKSNPNALTVD